MTFYQAVYLAALKGYLAGRSTGFGPAEAHDYARRVAHLATQDD